MDTKQTAQQTAQTGKTFAYIGSIGIVLVALSYLILGAHPAQAMTAVPFVAFLAMGLTIYAVSGRRLAAQAATSPTR